MHLFNRNRQLCSYGDACSLRLILRYALYQLPEIVVLILVIILIRHWVEIPEWVAWGVVLLWVIKDAALFPFVWRAFDRRGSDKLLSMVGQQGIATQRLDPAGYVRVRGELWQAEIIGQDYPAEKNQPVVVQAVSGLKLFVKAVKPAGDSGGGF
jgi:membrane protein implicated in regulation of membrane protease activity